LRTGNTGGVTVLLVKPTGPLNGEVQAFGAKNAVLKQLAAVLLASGEHHLTNVPRISDVETMLELLRALGCHTSRVADNEVVVEVPAREQLHPVAPAHLFEAMRASIVVLGPLLARCGEAHMALPGGDDFGGRPINFHTDGLGAMGATFDNGPDMIHATLRAPRLRAARITLEYPSHTATDNLLMAAVLADGRTVIDNAAREPEVEDLGRQLLAMGAHIEGLGTSRLTVEGVGELHPAVHHVVTDRVVSATYLAAAAVTGGDVRVTDARPEHMEMLLRKFEQMGCGVDLSGPGVQVSGPLRLRAVDVATLPYPGVATDYKPLITTILSVASGVSVVTENLFTGRFRYVEELRKLGASITTEGHHALVRGVDHLIGTSVRGTDIRAAAALILAGLVAEGETRVEGLEHLERGYDDLPAKMKSLGADVVRA
jgi:UDP-N-acetylglucosamine 1-carboxyvinyltransferase